MLSLACILGIAASTAACPDRLPEVERITAERHEEAFGMDDAAITLTVRAELADDEEIRPVNDIDVSTEDGVVRLSGEVPDEKMRQRAEAVARRVEGVRDVHNDLRVADELPTADLP
jgi:hyperosmotically inducible periplasmic protein